MSPVELHKHQESTLKNIEMTLPKSYGLQETLRDNPVYKARYENLVRHVENLSGMELIGKYYAEHNSWKNRKHWAKTHSVLWSPLMEKFGHFLLINGPIPQPHWTLDRIDPKGNYVPENLRWASKATQSQNRTSARLVVVGGECLTISEIADRSGRPYDTVRMSLDRNGDEHALYLVNNPATDPEFDWQFPEEYRDALDYLYFHRKHKEWSRMYFFIDLTYRDFLRVSRALENTTDSSERQALESEITLLRSLHNSTVALCRRFRADADTRSRFPNLVVPKRPDSGSDPDDSGYWPEDN